MLKEALKWVADHTGISWVLGKLSSGWKWLFSSKTDANENSVPKQSGEEEPAKQHDLSKNLVHEADNYLEVKDKRLYLNLTKENFEECKNYHNSNSVFFNKEAEAPQANIIPCNVNRIIFDNNNLVFSIASTHLAMCKGYLNPANKGEHLLFIQCGRKEYRITGTLVGYNVTINSIVEMENGMEKGEILCPANDMESIKAKLGLLSSDWVIVDSVARYPTASQPQQNEESEEERFVVRRATAKEIAAGRAARAAALNGGFNSMTASTATVVEDLLSKTCGEKPDSLINQTTTKKEVVAGEKSL